MVYIYVMPTNLIDTDFLGSLKIRSINSYPTNIYFFKVCNRNTRNRCELRSNLTMKTPEKRYWRRSGVFNVNFEHISQFFLVFLLLILNKWMLAG